MPNASDLLKRQEEEALLKHPPVGIRDLVPNLGDCRYR
jgi:hypothetical protein